MILPCPWVTEYVYVCHTLMSSYAQHHNCHPLMSCPGSQHCHPPMLSCPGLQYCHPLMFSCPGSQYILSRTQVVMPRGTILPSNFFIDKHWVFVTFMSDWTLQSQNLCKLKYKGTVIEWDGMSCHFECEQQRLNEVPVLELNNVYYINQTTSDLSVVTIWALSMRTGW